MNRLNSPRLFVMLVLCGLLFVSLSTKIHAQSQTPLTSDEFLRLVRQLPGHPEMRDELIGEIRRRGINFPLTSGIRSIVATKSGNDAALRRTLEEAERRRLNPVASALPSEAESLGVLTRARAATLAASEAMPDFVVKQLITRSFARGNTKNWIVADRLTIAVSYRASAGEQYRLLAVNGLPAGADSKESSNYENLGGTSSTGEYVTMLTALFSDEAEAEFKAVDTDLLRGRRTIIYDYTVLKPRSKYTITFNSQRSIIVGYRGRIWIDREAHRVLRMEQTATDIPPDFPITAASTTVDYDWVTIAERQYLLPSRAAVELTTTLPGQGTAQNRNVIHFRNYQKYGSEVKVIEEDIIDEEEPGAKP